MSSKYVRDVIGEPDCWPNFMRQEWKGPQDMQGATITDVFSEGDQIAVQTRGAPCGETFSTFVVPDQALRSRVLQNLKPDLDVYEAVAIAI